MNKSVLMIMGGAIVVALIVAMVVQMKLSPKTGGGPTVEILVANKKLPIGTRIKAEDVRWQAWPEAASFKGVIKKSEQKDPKKLDIYDVPLRRDIESGEPVTRQAIIADIKGGGNFLASTISPGMRAVSVPVKAETGAGGFLSPGDRVDVILSYTVKLNSPAARDVGSSVVSRNASQTVLSNVRVLGVDQKSKGEEAAKVAKTVTLEVSREGAEILALAVKMGTISLALRRLGEKDKPEDLVTPITTDATTTEVIRKLNDMVTKSTTRSDTVRVYSGTSVQNVPVRAQE